MEVSQNSTKLHQPIEEYPVLEPKKEKKRSYLFFSFVTGFILIGLVVSIIFATSHRLIKQTSSIAGGEAAAITATQDFKEEHVLLRDQEEIVEITMPDIFRTHLKKLSLSSHLSLDKIRQQYQDPELFCAGYCGVFKDSPHLLEQQFELLKKVSMAQNCSVTPELAQELKESFVLLAEGIETRSEVLGVYSTELDACGFRFFASDGYDAGIFNFQYQAVFLVDDSLISANFPIFIYGLNEQQNMIFEDIGFDVGNNFSCSTRCEDTGENLCGSSCIENEISYIEELDTNDEIVSSMLEMYDEAMGSLRFL